MLLRNDLIWMSYKSIWLDLHLLAAPNNVRLKNVSRNVVFVRFSPRVEVWAKNNVRLAVNSGEKKVFSPQSARIF